MKRNKFKMGLMSACLCLCASCGESSTTTTTTVPSTTTSVPSTTTTTIVAAMDLAAPVVNLEGDVVSWEAVSNATSYMVYVNDKLVMTQTELSYVLTDYEVGSYEIYVKAISTDTLHYNPSDKSNVVKYTVSAELLNTTIYFVGDSTVCSFEDSYYLPRYGYGTQIANYLDSEHTTVVNYALSGRSSRSFLSESNYEALSSNIKEGDYLFIGFGHNDEKAELARYSNPNLAYTDSTTTFTSSNEYGPISFKYVLYHYYIELAESKGATPILCTPIVRLNASNDYSGSSAHITSTTTTGGETYQGGNYSQAIIELGNETNTEVVDLTSITKADYTVLGYDEASNYHAFTSTKNGVRAGIDTTHTNIYGAKMNAYHIAQEISSSSSSLKAYITNLVKPTVADLVPNPSYVEPTYESFDETKASTNWTLPTGWYGTVFGDCGGATKASPSYYTIGYENDKFTVGAASNVGKVGSSEGIAMAFKQIAINQNFEFSATVTLDTYKGGNQTAFGLMVRDDIYIDTFDNSIKSNSICAGSYVSGSGAITNAIYSRVNQAIKAENQISALTEGTSIKLSIVKINQQITVKFGDYTKTYYDFDLAQIDNEYLYIGMYATRSTIASFSNVVVNMTGTSVEA